MRTDRRTFVAAAGAYLSGCSVHRLARPQAADGLDKILPDLGPNARFGAAAIDASNGRTLSHDGEGRYAMCSLFKVPLAAAILARVDRGDLSLATSIPFTARDVLEYAPVIKANLTAGRLTMGELCAAAVEISDNSAANLLLPFVGGPAGLTRFMRTCGDRISRLDRVEPDLNTNLPADVRDTTTPTAMAGLLRALLAGRILSFDSRQRLISWMVQSKTGKGRIRAGLPQGWPVGTKSGTGENGAANDSAIFWPPGRAPVLLVTFVSGGTASAAERDVAHARAARYFADAALRGFPG